MVPPGRLIVLLTGAAIACYGLGLGAGFQFERYLGPVGGDNDINLGEPILLTGLLVAAGVVTMALALAPSVVPSALPRPSKRPLPAPRNLASVLVWPFIATRRVIVHAGRLFAWKMRPALVAHILASAGLFVGAYFAVNLVQNAWPTVVAATLTAEGQNASQLPYFMSIGLLASNSRDVLPATLVPIMALLAGAGLVMAACFRILMRAGRPAKPLGPGQLLGRQLAAYGLAAPFLALSGWAAMRLMVGLPSEAAAGPFLVVLPACAIAAWGLLVTGFLKTWHLARALQDRMRAPVGLEAWQAIGRVEVGLACALAATAAAAFVLPRITVAGLSDPSAPFGVATINILLQFLLMLAIPLLPLALLHRPGLRVLQARPSHTVAPPSARLVWAIPVAAALCFILAGFATWSLSRALWGWVLASLPLAALGFLSTRPIAAVPAAWLAAAALWGIGNTVYATYLPGPVGLPEFDTTPGVLGLWRLCGAALAAVALARLARGHATTMRPTLALPLAIGLGAALATLALVELPLTAGPDHSIDGSSIVVGSALAASDAAVQALYHGLAAVAMASAALIAARILRPEWFGASRRRPLAAPVADPIT